MASTSTCYVVVEYLKKRLIPPLWIDKAYWPPYPDDKRCLKAAKMIKAPGTNWEMNDTKEWSKSGKLQP